MDYLNKTENLLKSCLKGKRKITTATVVAFLIMGTASFSATSIYGTKTGSTSHNYTTIGEKEYNELVDTKAETSPNGQYADILIVGKGEDAQNVTFQNINHKSADSQYRFIKIDGINTQSKLTATLEDTVNIESNTVILDIVGANVVNKGNLTYTGPTTDNVAGIGSPSGTTGKAINISGKKSGKEDFGDASFTNEGTVKVTEKGATAIRLTAGEGNIVTLNNSGTIIGDIDSYIIGGGKGTVNINLTEGSHIEGEINLLKGENSTINITGVGKDKAEELNYIKYADKINITDGSNIVIKDGFTETDIVGNTGLINVENSDLDNSMDITGTGNTQKNSALITNYGKAEGVYNLINRGDLKSDYAQNGIYSNASNGAEVKVTNEGTVTIGTAGDNTKSKTASGWATGLTGKFDADTENSKIAITNNGIINITNGAGIDITNAGKDSNVGTAVNSESGTINVTGFGVGMLADGKGVTATNKGIINMIDSAKSGDKFSYGMQAKNGAEAINNGTIILSVAKEQNVKAMGTGDQGTDNAVNDGTIKLSNVTRDEIKNYKATEKEEATGVTEADLLKYLGISENNGLLVDKFGKAIFAEAGENDTDLSGSEPVTAGDLKENAKDGAIFVGEGTEGTITASKTEEKVDTITGNNFKVLGTLNIAKGDNSTTTVAVEDSVMNIASGGKIAIGNGAEFALTNGQINGQEGETAITFESQDASLALDGTTVFGNIGDNVKNGNLTASGITSIKGDITAKSFNIAGEAEKENMIYVDGVISAGTITVGTSEGEISLLNGEEVNLPETVTKDTILKLSSASSFGKAGTVEVKDDGQIILEVESDGTNAFGNTELGSFSKVTIKGDNDTSTTEIVLDTSKISGEGATVDFGSVVGDAQSTATVDTNSEIYVIEHPTPLENNEKGMEIGGDIDKVEVVYNSNLYKDDAEINNINNAAKYVNTFFSQDTAVRKTQLETLRDSNIYSETVKAAYDNTKLVEDSILSLDTDTVAGKWTANGKALYSKNEYDRADKYSSDIESTGLLASLEYGLNDSSSVGFAFAGVKQDLDSDGGNADGDVFYFGAFANKTIGNNKLTAGLGYQLGKYDADNTAASVSSGDKYDSNAFSAYVQGKHIVKVEEGLTFEPKLKLGYAYIDQDDVKDDYFRLKDAELSTFNAELGFDVVKTVQFDKSKLDVVFGASYVRAMGDTDNKFTGSFAGNNGTFDVLGAELDENTVKFNLTGEVMNENGFFYNGGFTYRFGGEDTKDYGVNVGVGYSF